MLNPKQVRDYIIYPMLDVLALHKNDDERDSAAQLLLGTAMQESGLVYLHQLGSGPAMGLCQMEPNTYNDHVSWMHKTCLQNKVATYFESLFQGYPSPNAMIYDLRLAFIMCRVHYYRVQEALPPKDTPAQHASYWKRYYNTIMGAGTEPEYLENWRTVSALLY